MKNYYYPSLKKCIYCGTTTPPPGTHRFGDEHVIPLALGGNLIIKEASCRNCEKIINEEIESPVLPKEWIYLRIKNNFPTRKKSKNRPTHVTLQCHDGSSIQIPISDYSAPVPLYKFTEPRILTRASRINDNMHWTMSILSSHEAKTGMRQKYPLWNGIHSIIPQPFKFARLIAKIAYCRAVSEYGLEGFTPLVLPIILGHSDDYFYTVGGSLEISPAIPGGDHVLNLAILFRPQTIAILIIEVRLFSQIDTPTYKVVVGEINLNNLQHSSVFNSHMHDGKLAVEGS
jgi:hypothetical protein